MLRVVFLGTPRFAVPTFQALLADPNIELVGVVTQPDRPSGRGQKLTPPPIKELALEAGLPIQQPKSIRKDQGVIAWLRALEPDFFVTAAFGQILSQEVLDIPTHGTVNVHGSLLPRWRGANPVQQAILHNDSVTGITTMLTDIGVDTGPMLLKAETPITTEDTMLTVLERLSQIGADILPRTLHGVADGSVQPEPQDEALATHAPKLSKEDTWIDWSQSAMVIHNKIRGQVPWPGTTSRLNGEVLKIHQSRVLDSDTKASPGAIVSVDKNGLTVQTGEGTLLITQLQAPGKPKMDAHAWANGALASGEPAAFDTVDMTVVT